MHRQWVARDLDAGASMTLLEFEAAATGTRIIPTRPSKLIEEGPLLLSENVHHARCHATVSHEIDHEIHGPVDVVEEGFESITQIVESRFTIRRVNEPVLRALAVTGESHIAVEAILRKAVPLGLSELVLLR